MMNTNQYLYVIGIDVGVNTGIAVWNRQTKSFGIIKTMMIHEAMMYVKNLVDAYADKVLIRVEDARLRKYFGNTGKEKLQGAGSIKRDSKIWEDYLKTLNAHFEMIAPKSNKTKVTADYFKMLTKCDATTSVHARDAAMLCYGF